MNESKVPAPREEEERKEKFRLEMRKKQTGCGVSYLIFSLIACGCFNNLY